MTVDLTTMYLGLRLKNPLVASASPLMKRVDTVRQLEDAGVAAVVMYSLFEEQIRHESQELAHYITQGQHTFVEVNSYFPDFQSYQVGPDGYLEEVARLKQAVGIPVIGSLNGTSSGGWVDYAQRIEQAGADALELNTYFLVTNPETSSAEQEDRYVELVREVCSRVRIPVAVKLSPFFTALPHLVRRLEEAGARGVVLFNRFYQPDFDLEADEVVPNLVLSTSNDLRLPLRWVSLLYGRTKVDMAASGGVHTASDVLKVVMAGASVAMTTSALLRYGAGRAGEILGDLEAWMGEKEYVSIQQMQGRMSHRAVSEPAALERANYMKELNSFHTLGTLYGASGSGLSATAIDEGYLSV
ncbi:MAG: dihydroorotate dehydrogenase-like protein [Chloroflexaceae bacterium]|nr:dihydroorotate dehydrogenase-like protein [Chloroflexaceae bacterium]